MPPMPDFVRPGLLNPRNVVGAIAAATVGLAAFFGVRLAFSGDEPAPTPVVVEAPAPEPEPEPEPPPPQPATEPAQRMVLVARQTIESGLRLTMEMLDWREWSGRSNIDFAVLQDEVPLETVLGALTKRRIEEGAMVTWDNLILPGGPGFLTSMLTPGFRAVTVEVDRATTAANIIRPGDRVDVILTYSGDHVPTLAGVGPVAQVIAADVLVLAVGSHTIETHPFYSGSLGDTLTRIADASPPQGDTYTLEVHARDAERLALSSRQITLALRPFSTNQSTPLYPRLVGFEDVLTTAPEPEEQPTPAPPVIIIRGAGSVQAVVDAPRTAAPTAAPTAGAPAAEGGAAS